MISLCISAAIGRSPFLFASRPPDSPCCGSAGHACEGFSLMVDDLLVWLGRRACPGSLSLFLVCPSFTRSVACLAATSTSSPNQTGIKSSRYDRRIIRCMRHRCCINRTLWQKTVKGDETCALVLHLPKCRRKSRTITCARLYKDTLQNLP